VRDALKVHEPLSRGVFAVVVLVSLAVLFAPASDVPSSPPGVDKVVHADVAGIMLGLLIWQWLGHRADRRTDRLA
jgi:hypothetical protein